MLSKIYMMFLEYIFRKAFFYAKSSSLCNIMLNYFFTIKSTSVMQIALNLNTI